LLSALTAEWSGSKTTGKALEMLAQARIPAGPLLKPRQELQNGHVDAADYLAHIEVPGLKRLVPYVKPAYRLSASPAEIVSGPPLPGQHTNEILKDLGYTPEQIDDLRARSLV